ncbi:glycosyltransferase family 4 protein [Canibacter zhoujuaniae]|uniref:glycosyltransferase family 4 protein n=1 Tax=Canibacter zhoujuaniae TaxID=2708343 RepID=UPI00141FF1FD|nr:glycosyltransferase family 4 protein [Canibacter zhoujuaniae]
MELTKARVNPIHRVALVIDYSLSYLGGAQSAFLDHAHALAGYGHRVTIIAPGTKDDAWVKEWGGSALPIKPAGTLPGLDLPIIRNRAGLRAQLADYLRRLHIDIVHTHSEFGLSAAAVSAARDEDIPVVHTVHTFFWQARLAGPIDILGAAAVRSGINWLTRGEAALGKATPGSGVWPNKRTDALLQEVTASAASRADITISPSAHQADKLRAAGVGEVRVIPNVNTRSDFGAPLTAVEAPLRLVWVGRLVAEKRVLEFIQAIDAVVKTLGSAALTVQIIGAGPLERAARRSAAHLPITFTGRLSREEVTQQMRAAHATVLTSFGFDNQPVTIIESVHARRPVIVCDPQLREGLTHSGIYAAGPNPAEIAAKIVELVRDPAKLLSASEATVIDATDFDPANHVAKLRAVYAQAELAS